MYTGTESTNSLWTINVYDDTRDCIVYLYREVEEDDDESYELDDWFIIYKLHYLRKVDRCTNNILKLMRWSKSSIDLILFQKKWNYLKQFIRRRKRLRNKKDRAI